MSANSETAEISVPSVPDFSAKQKIQDSQFWRKKVPVENAEGIVCAGYRRCWDFDERDTFGQDAVCVSVLGSVVVAMVADGVSSGFNGNIAADVLSSIVFDKLCDFWKTHHEGPNGEIVLSWLSNVSDKISEAVQEYDPPSDLPEFVRSLLAERKETVPSQTVFSAFLYDMMLQTAHCYVVGDAPLFVHQHGVSQSTELKPVEISDEARIEGVKAGVVIANSDGRITSMGKSDPHFVYQKYDHVVAIAAQSDGMIPLWGAWLGGLSDEDKLRAKLDGEAWRDDISFAAALSPMMTSKRSNAYLYPPGQPPTTRSHTDLTRDSDMDTIVPSSELHTASPVAEQGDELQDKKIPQHPGHIQTEAEKTQTISAVPNASITEPHSFVTSHSVQNERPDEAISKTPEWEHAAPFSEGLEQI